MGDTIQNSMYAALIVGAVFLIAYQVGMLVWTRKTAGRVPRAIVIIRSTNIGLLLVAVALVAWRLAR